jgi:hypothetical protein
MQNLQNLQNQLVARGGGAASNVRRFFDVGNFQLGVPFVVPGTEYRVLNLVL